MVAACAMNKHNNTTRVWTMICFWCFMTNKVSNGERIPEGSATLAFVFDTTGSMYDDLVQVRAGASKILSAALQMQARPLYNYALVPFHDPGEWRSSS